MTSPFFEPFWGHILSLPVFSVIFYTISIFSTSSDDNTTSSKSQKSCGLPTIKEGCCEEKESPLVDIEDILSESVNKSAATFKSYLRTSNGNW